jgi:hypothetical protein
VLANLHCSGRLLEETRSSEWLYACQEKKIGRCSSELSLAFHSLQGRGGAPRQVAAGKYPSTSRVDAVHGLIQQLGLISQREVITE